MNALTLPEAWRSRAIVITHGGAADADWFTEAELRTAAAFRLEKRRNEWLLSRMAAKALAMRLGLCDDPHRCTVARPDLLIDEARAGWCVSVSHSGGHAAAAIDRRAVGIDVQLVRDLDESSAHLFLSDDEAAAMRRCSSAHRILHFWCAKEAAWKARSSEFMTLKSLPLRLEAERADGVAFDAAETFASGNVIVALTR